MHTIRFDGKTPGICGTCLVTVVEGAEHLSEKGGAESRVLLALKANPDQRLACQTWARGDVSVKY